MNEYFISPWNKMRQDKYSKDLKKLRRYVSKVDKYQSKVKTPIICPKACEPTPYRPISNRVTTSTKANIGKSTNVPSINLSRALPSAKLSTVMVTSFPRVSPIKKSPKRFFRSKKRSARPSVAHANYWKAPVNPWESKTSSKVSTRLSQAAKKSSPVRKPSWHRTPSPTGKKSKRIKQRSKKPETRSGWDAATVYSWQNAPTGRTYGGSKRVKSPRTRKTHRTRKVSKRARSARKSIKTLSR